MQKTWVPEFTPNLQKFTEIYATFYAIYKNLRNLQRKLDLAPGPTPIFNRLACCVIRCNMWYVSFVRENPFCLRNRPGVCAIEYHLRMRGNSSLELSLNLARLVTVDAGLLRVVDRRLRKIVQH